MIDNNISRRDFFIRCTKAGLSAAAVAALASLLYEADPAKISPLSADFIEPMNYSIPPVAGQTISIVTGSNRQATVTKAVELLGGMQRFIKPGDNVLLKPNVINSMPPERAVCTHPAVVRAAAEWVLSKGGLVTVGDQPGYALTEDVEPCFRNTGTQCFALQ